jgi:hypothetical protein
MLYDIIFQNDYRGHYSVVATVDTLAKARNARTVSGDIVVYHKTTQVVRDKEWLWDWEKDDPHCYAVRRMEMDDVEGVRIN